MSQLNIKFVLWNGGADDTLSVIRHGANGLEPDFAPFLPLPVFVDSCFE